MIAAKNKTISGATQNRLHPAPVCLDSRGLWITKPAAMPRTPEVGVEFKVAASPFLPHRFKHLLQVSLPFGIRSIQLLPGTVPPATKRHSVGPQGVDMLISH